MAIQKITGKAIEIVTFLMGADKDVLWDLVPHRKKRSLDSNAYFHVLCDKLRLSLGISMTCCKNHLIADYGQILYLPDGEPMIWKSNAPEEYMMEFEALHTKCIRITKEIGKPVFFYRIYRGSHTYDTIEMNHLITGTIEECRAQGIEVASPEELKHMEMLWEKRYNKAHSQKEEKDNE